MITARLPRRWIEELALRYKLHPKLRDVYVEGFFDKEIIQSWLSHQGIHSPGIYSIDSVDLPIELLSKYSVTEGCKQRVIALANELASAGHTTSALCIIDSDFDKFLGISHSSKNLLATDFSCLESYFWVDDILQSAFRSAIGAQKRKAGQVAELEQILRGLFALRMVDQKLGLSLSWIDIKSYVKVAEGNVTIDLALYAERVLVSSGKANVRVAFLAEVANLLATFPADTRHCLRGHDLVKLLSLVVRKLGGAKGFHDESAFETIMLTMCKFLDTAAGELWPRLLIHTKPT